LIEGERLFVACGPGAVEVTEIQQEGKKRLNAEDFLRGYSLTAGDVIG
jgi:methionyl-tRNA formyltransferase